MKRIALAYGVFTHALFVAAVGAMIVGLATGLQSGLGRLSGASAWFANFALAIEFPVLHTLFLSTRGRRWLGRLAPTRLRQDLGTTLYAAFASLQVLATFALWSPSGAVWFAPTGLLATVSWSLYGASWLLVGKAMWDASLALQTGSLGWWAAYQGRRPRYPRFPTQGLFAHWRQPIYTAFAAALVSAPVWTPDRVLLVAVWGAYCVVGPVFKEQRYLRAYGVPFAEYRATHPYWLPRIVRR